jgi:hypothetical protein
MVFDTAEEVGSDKVEDPALLVEKLKRENEVTPDIIVMDFDIMSQFFRTRSYGKLFIAGTAPAIPIEFGLIAVGKKRLYILPSPNLSPDNVDFLVEDILADGLTYLEYGNVKVYFTEVSEVMSDDKKVLVICKPSE